MKPLFLLIALLCLQSPAAWRPDEFVVGAFHEPPFSGNPGDDSATFRKYNDLGFTVVTGHVLNGVQDPWNTGYVFFREGSLAHPVDALYRLNVLARIPGLRTFIWERGVNAGAAEALKTARSFASVPSTIAPSYTKALRDKVFGYTGYRDEAPFTAVKSDLLPVIRAVHAGDPARPSCPNFGCGLAAWNGAVPGDGFAKFQANMNNFRAALAEYLGDTATSLFSFDYYKFFWYFSPSGKKMGPMTGGSPSHTFYAHLKIAAEETKRTGKVYYGVPCCAHHEIQEYSRQNVARQWNPLCVRKFLNPAGSPQPVTEAFLRHEAYSYVLYGAKGLLWFSYFTPSQKEIIPWRDPPFNGLVGSREVYIDQPSNNEGIRAAVQKINREISRLGPVLLELTWVGVGHGAAVDPHIGEPWLPPLSSGLPPLYSGGRGAVEPADGARGWKPDSLAIGVFTRGSEYYLALMNKSLTSGNRSKCNCAGKFSPRVFDRETGDWKALGKTGYDSDRNITSFELDRPLAPGDLQLIRLNRN